MYRKYVPFLLFLFFLYGCNGNKQEEKEDVPFSWIYRN